MVTEIQVAIDTLCRILFMQFVVFAGTFVRICKQPMWFSLHTWRHLANIQGAPAMSQGTARRTPVDLTANTYFRAEHLLRVGCCEQLGQMSGLPQKT